MMNSKILTVFFAMILMVSVLMPTAAIAATDTEATPEYNKSDPNIEADNARLALDNQTEAEFLARAACPTGKCFGSTVGTVGFDQTPTIDVPADAAAKTGTATGGKTKK